MAQPTRHKDQQALRALVQRFVRDFGLLDDARTPCGQPMKTSSAHALMILLQVGIDGIHQAALARQLGIDKSNVSRLMRQLLAKGHVVITTSPDEDARLKRIKLSPRGKRLAMQVDDASRLRFATLFARLSATQRRTAIAGLKTLLGALKLSPNERTAR